MVQGPRQANDSTVLSAAAAKTATGDTTATPVRLCYAQGIAFELDVTAAGSIAGDTLDVTVQTRIDGVNWFDVVHFTQVLGNGGAKRFIAKVAPGLAEAMFATATALTAGNIRNIAGDDWAVTWTIVNGGGTHSFTFSVTAIPM